jgi:hypothetical protein
MMRVTVDSSTNPIVRWLALTAACHMATHRTWRSVAPLGGDISVMFGLSPEVTVK